MGRDHHNQNHQKAATSSLFSAKQQKHNEAEKKLQKKQEKKIKKEEKRQTELLALEQEIKNIIENLSPQHIGPLDLHAPTLRLLPQRIVTLFKKLADSPFQSSDELNKNLLTSVKSFLEKIISEVCKELNTLSENIINFNKSTKYNFELNEENCVCIRISYQATTEELPKMLEILCEDLNKRENFLFSCEAMFSAFELYFEACNYLNSRKNSPQKEDPSYLIKDLYHHFIENYFHKIIKDYYLFFLLLEGVNNSREVQTAGPNLFKETILFFTAKALTFSIKASKLSPDLRSEPFFTEYYPFFISAKKSLKNLSLYYRSYGSDRRIKDFEVEEMIRVLSEIEDLRRAANPSLDISRKNIQEWFQQSNDKITELCQCLSSARQTSEESLMELKLDEVSSLLLSSLGIYESLSKSYRYKLLDLLKNTLHLMAVMSTRSFLLLEMPRGLKERILGYADWLDEAVQTRIVFLKKENHEDHLKKMSVDKLERLNKRLAFLFEKSQEIKVLSDELSLSVSQYEIQKIIPSVDLLNGLVFVSNKISEIIKKKKQSQTQQERKMIAADQHSLKLQNNLMSELAQQKQQKSNKEDRRRQLRSASLCSHQSLPKKAEEKINENSHDLGFHAPQLVETLLQKNPFQDFCDALFELVKEKKHSDVVEDAWLKLLDNIEWFYQEKKRSTSQEEEFLLAKILALQADIRVYYIQKCLKKKVVIGDDSHLTDVITQYHQHCQIAIDNLTAALCIVEQYQENPDKQTFQDYLSETQDHIKSLITYLEAKFSAILANIKPTNTILSSPKKNWEDFSVKAKTRVIANTALYNVYCVELAQNLLQSCIYANSLAFLKRSEEIIDDLEKRMPFLFRSKKFNTLKKILEEVRDMLLEKIDSRKRENKFYQKINQMTQAIFNQQETLEEVIERINEGREHNLRFYPTTASVEKTEKEKTLVKAEIPVGGASDGSLNGNVLIEQKPQGVETHMRIFAIKESFQITCQQDEKTDRLVYPLIVERLGPYLAILNELHARAYVAYIQGGCLRDLILSGEAARREDIDIISNAPPAEIQAIFSRSLGNPFLDSFLVKPTKLENVMQLRQPRSTLFFQAPQDDVRVVIYFEEKLPHLSLEEIARQQDFSCNQLFLDKEGIIHVPLADTMQALKLKRLNLCNVKINNAKVVLRAFYFHAKLDFDLSLVSPCIMLYLEEINYRSQITYLEFVIQLAKLMKYADYGKTLNLLDEHGFLQQVFDLENLDKTQVINYCQKISGLCSDMFKPSVLLAALIASQVESLEQMEMYLLEWLPSFKSDPSFLVNQAVQNLKMLGALLKPVASFKLAAASL
ncbi:MAG: hypothetical protein A3I12_05070 [Gammaproteobacteria bacterium RIFCSPLOWO2_02_FULL_38_11]|nr:MAG: hypothetical protein A3I12_05070 [Gammaproteobacteria bacterium RIFCSPLOWO2_02_FULL_38_11]